MRPRRETLADIFSGDSRKNFTARLNRAEHLSLAFWQAKSIKVAKALKPVLPHVGLVVAFLIYILLGGLIFYSAEHPLEAAQKAHKVLQLFTLHHNFLDLSWNISNSRTEADINETLWRDEYQSEVNSFAVEMLGGMSDSKLSPDDIFSNDTRLLWRFDSAVRFALTIITTIGYGNISPSNDMTRAICVIYASVGIPLALFTIADMGKFVSRFITWLYRKYQKARRKMKQAATSNIAFQMSRATANMFAPAMIDLSPSPVAPDADTEDTEGDSAEANAPPVAAVGPVFVLLLLLGYSAIGAGFFQLSEDWSFVDGVYYCFITMATIGFGDIVPSDNEYFLLEISYILFGLILNSTCIEMVGGHYIRKIHYFGRKIQDAKSAFVLLSSKAHNAGEYMKNIRLLQLKFGLTDKQLEKLMVDTVQVSMELDPLEEIRQLRKYFPPSDLRYIDCTLSCNYHDSEDDCLCDEL